MPRPKTPETVLRELSTSGINGVSMDREGVVSVGPDWNVPLVEYPRKNRGEDAMEESEEFMHSPKPIKDRLMEKPVENEEPIPLIPNLEGNARQVITKIRVHRRTPPNDGIKGDVPASTTMEFIARRWGDGIYDFEAMNQNDQILRRNVNVKIAMGYGVGFSDNSQAQKTTPAFIPDSGIADKVLSRLDTESERSHKYATVALETTQKISSDYASMIREDSQVRSERDREFFRANSEQQSNFFQTMLVTMQTMHAQSMAQAREGFNQTLQMMQMGHQQMLAANNPSNILAMFERGLRLGADASTEASDSPLATVLGAGVDGLRQIKELALLQQNTASGKMPQVGSQIANPSPATNLAPKKKPAISKAELMEVIKLKRLAESKGYPFDGLVQQAQAMISNAPSNDEDIEDDNEESEESSELEGGDSE